MRAGTATGDRRSVWVRLREPWRLEAEVAFVVCVVFLWQAIRIPIEGTRDGSIAHARDWLALERLVHLDVEGPLIAFGHKPHVFEAFRWWYANGHVPAMIACLVLFRLTGSVGELLQNSTAAGSASILRSRSSSRSRPRASRRGARSQVSRSSTRWACSS